MLERTRKASLTYFEFPGGGYSLDSLGLDATLEELGLSPVPTPRHADVLFVSGPVTPALEEPLRLIYAAMPRPRYAVALGAEEDLSVPVDAHAARDDSSLEEAVRALLERIAGGYRGAPPIEEPAHPDGHEGHGEMDHAEHDMGDMDHGDHDMEGMDHGGHDMEGMDHSHMMGDMYESEDGLALETVEMPLGPVHPATPGGLGLTVTLDGDLVAETELEEGYLGRKVAERAVHADPEDALEALRWLDPRTPVSVPALYVRAFEDLAGAEAPGAARFGRVYLLELERASSHLLWLSGFA
ncbi:MAG: hypothetical protein WA990_05790, partial [Rubrobacteraceae bacterium]